MKLYVTRHGETDWNKVNRVLGRPDIPLNETGFKQAEHLAKRIADVQIDKVYTSPLSRARQTAQAVTNAKGLEDAVVEDRLIEQSFGIFEGESRADPIYQQEKHQYFKPFENGESFLDVAARVYPFLKELLDNADPQENILLVTHGGIARIIANYFQGMDNDAFASFFMKNCQLMEINPETKTVTFLEDEGIE